MLQTTANAACESYRLVGQWKSYIIPSQSNWAACKFIVKDNGFFDKNSSCVGSSFNKASVSGNLRFDRECNVVGRFVLQGQTFEIINASDNIDQSKLGGIIRMPTGQFGAFLALRE